ncbi:hypothetical protein ACQJBY_054430 [Aegilops geniculata]
MSGYGHWSLLVVGRSSSPPPEDHDLERLAVETVVVLCITSRVIGRCTSHCRPHRRHKQTPASLPATRTSLAQPVSKVVAASTRPTPTAWLMLQCKTVEPAGGVTRSRTSCSTVQLLVLWPVAQGAECRPQ